MIVLLGVQVQDLCARIGGSAASDQLVEHPASPVRNSLNFLGPLTSFTVFPGAYQEEQGLCGVANIAHCVPVVRGIEIVIDFICLPRNIWV